MKNQVQTELILIYIFLKNSAHLFYIFLKILRIELINVTNGI